MWGSGWGVRVDVNEELKFWENSQKKNRGGGGGGGRVLVGGHGGCECNVGGNVGHGGCEPRIEGIVQY